MNTIPKEYQNLIRIYRINVEVIMEMISPIAAATKIRPLKHADGSDDIRAIDEFEDFIVNALAVFDEHDFEVIEEHKSPYKDSNSWYFTLVKRDQLAAKSYKYILFIRLSDHKNKETTDAGRQRFYSEVADRLKQPPTKARQTWRLKEITVNKDVYFSYEEALEDIDRRLD